VLGETYGLSYYYDTSSDRRNELCEQLNAVATAAEQRANWVPIKKGQRQKSSAKINAAQMAYDLMKNLNLTPTLTIGGQFYDLASIIFEGATGVKDANLDWHCKWVFHRN
jgi:hypothetical protein